MAPSPASPGHCAACHHPIRRHARPCPPRRIPNAACPEQLAGRTCVGGICKVIGCACHAAVEHLTAAPVKAPSSGRSRRGGWS